MRREERYTNERIDSRRYRNGCNHNEDRNPIGIVLLAALGVVLILIGSIAGTSMYYHQKMKLSEQGNIREAVVYQQPVSETGTTQDYSQEAVLQEIKEYTVSAYVASNGGGTVTGGGKYRDNTAATVSAIPDEHYRFTGWTENGSIVSTEVNYVFGVTGDRELSANFEKMSYTVRFVNEDGTELQSRKEEFGETPEYRGETPIKAATEEYIFTFAGWSSEIAPVTGDVTYTAKFEKAVKNVGTPGLDASGKHLWDLNQIKDGNNTFYTMFSAQKSVTDYSGKVHKDEDPKTHEKTPLFVVSGDGQGECYRKAVTFINDKNYTHITGKIYLPDDAETLEKIKTGRMTLVLVDQNGKQLYINEKWVLTSERREAEFDIPIGGMKEFTLGVYSTDGRAGGDNMKMIVEGLELTE